MTNSMDHPLKYIGGGTEGGGAQGHVHPQYFGKGDTYMSVPSPIIWLNLRAIQVENGHFCVKK